MHVVILGAGISGLTAAWQFCKAGAKVTVVEKNARAGGWVQSCTCKGFFFEQGPRSCRTSGTGSATLALIEELGLCDQVLLPSPFAKRRYLYTDKRLQKVPQSLLSAFFSPLLRPALGSLLKEWRVCPSQELDESVDTFFRRRVGPYVAKTLIDPLVLGIYAGKSDRLSMRACFPDLYRLEQKAGSLSKGMFLPRKSQASASGFVKKMQRCSLFTLRLGMSQLIDALAQRLDAHIRYKAQATHLCQEADHIRVEMQTGQPLYADHVAAALPARALAPLLAEADPLLARSLAAERTSSVVVVNLGYEDRVLKKEGFGYLVPSKECERLLGVVFDSLVFPEQNNCMDETRLTCMIGGAHLPRPEVYSDEDYLVIAQEALERHAGITQLPSAKHVTRAVSAISQYEVGHVQKVVHWRKAALRLFPQLSLIGSSYDGVSVNDCIASATQVCKK